MGKVVIEPQYDYALDFSEGLVAVRRNGKWGFIDKTGKVVIKLQYDFVSGFSEGLAVVQNGRKWRYIDPSGKTIIELQIEGRAYDFKHGVAGINDSNYELVGFIDKTGKYIWRRRN
jgi:hypothetical protein